MYALCWAWLKRMAIGIRLNIFSIGARTLPKPREEKSEDAIKNYTKVEAVKILSVCRTLAFIFYACMFGGFRVGEFLGVEWFNLDYNNSANYY